jgi:hypothetical protein
MNSKRITQVNPIRVTTGSVVSTHMNAYVSVLTVVVLAVAYLDLANYYSVLSFGAFPPKYAYYMISAAIAPLALLGKKALWRYLNTPYIFWTVAMVVLNLVHWAVLTEYGNPEAAVIALTRLQYLVLAALIGFLLIQAPPSLLGRVSIGLALILTALQAADFFLPGMIVPFGTEGVVTGRAGSTLINANKAAESLILLTVLGMPVLRPTWRIWMVLIVFPGILLSFSRSGLMAWAIIVAGMLWFRLVPRSTYWFVLILVPFAISVASALSTLLLEFVEVAAQDNVFARLTFFLNYDTGDYSAQERLAIAKVAIESFLSQPFVGYGAGFTHTGSVFDAAPHNQHLIILAEYGLLGYALFIWMTTLLFLGGRGYFMSLQTPRMAVIAFAVFLLITFFSHSMFDNICWLVSFAILCQRRWFFYQR